MTVGSRTMDRFRLDGDVVAVTGANGLLGRRFCGAIADAGASLALLDVVTPEEVRREVSARLAPSAEAVAISCDVRDDASVEEALSLAEEALGPLTGLVNAAAVNSVPSEAGASVDGPFAITSSESIAAALDVNLEGVVRCCRILGAPMAERGRGSIVNIASHYGIVGPDQRMYASLRDAGKQFYKPVAYTVAKSGVIGLTRYLAAYWGEHGVRVNTLSPGGAFDDQDPGFVAAYSSRTPMGRMANVDEYDAAVVFLLSDAASYMTGSNLVIDGGFTAW